MLLEVKIITDKNIWENFLLEKNEKTFLQSWNWGEFQKRMGNKIWRLGVYEISNLPRSFVPPATPRNDEVDESETSNLAGVALLIKIGARRGKFLFLPHGPLLRNGIFNFQFSIFKHKVLETLLEELKTIAKRENCSFIRVASIWERNEENLKIFKDLGFRTAPIHMHPELTLELNIEKPEEELLMDMRKTTRYLIRQGLKNKDIEILKSQNIKDIEVFNQLYQGTVARHHFVPFSLNYLKNEFLAFSGDSSASTITCERGGVQNDKTAPSQDGSSALIFLAKYKDNYLTGALIVFWQGIAFYHQGASSQKYSKIPAPYLLQWEAIKEAKKRGCKIYNFWGIADVNSEKELQRHPWRGLSLFKKGFGGNEKKYVKTQDLPLAFRYWLTCIFEKTRKVKRGF